MTITVEIAIVIALICWIIFGLLPIHTKAKEILAIVVAVVLGFILLGLLGVI